jgi:RNA polymerase sigma factor (sigma-70 family)
MSNEELVLLYQQGDRQALETLAENNTGIINKLAFKYSNINKLTDTDDLKQAGYIGLINAANRYDFELENRSNFMTFAFYHIDREMKVCLNGRSSKDINNNKFYKTVKSLNVPIGEDEESDIELIDTVDSRSKDMENVEDKLYYKQLRNELETAMTSTNTLQEQEVLKLFYGWNIEPLTSTEIEELLNLQLNKSKSIKSKALNKLRYSKWYRLYGIKYYAEEIASHNYSYRTVEKQIDFNLALRI